MGSGTSRGKRVAPVCASDVTVAKTAAGTSPKPVNRPFKSSKINAMLRNARNRAQPDCHSEGHDSDFSREDDDIDGEMNTVRADYEKRGWASAKKSPPKKTAVRSRTYGLCHSSQEEHDSGSEEPRGSKVVNKRSDDAFQHLKRHTPASSSPLSVRTFIILLQNASFPIITLK